MLENPVYKMREGAKFPGKCGVCGNRISVGDPAIYDSDKKKVYHPSCVTVEAPATATAAPATYPDPILRLCAGGKAWSVALDRNQHNERATIKAAGFWWHGPNKCETGNCFACKLNVPRMDWFTTEYHIANKFRNYGTPEAVNKIDTFIKVEESSRSIADSDETIPIPVGLKYFPYQVAGIKWLSQYPRTMIGDEMGLGKTIQLLGLLNLTPSIIKTLIIAPVTLCINWKKEANKFLVRPTEVVILNDSDDIETVLKSNKPIIAITNSQKLIKGRGKGLFESVSSIKWDLVVVDEAHKLKNPKSQQTLAILGTYKTPGLLRKADRAIILTGTPIPNRVKELFPLINAIRPDVWKSYLYTFKEEDGTEKLSGFAKTYCDAHYETVLVRGGHGKTREILKDDGAINLDKLQAKLRSTGTMIRRLKSDVLKDLPPKLRRVLSLEADTSEAKKYLKSQQKDMDSYDQTFVESQMHLAEGDVESWKRSLLKLAENMKNIKFNEMAAERIALGKAKLPGAIEHITDLLESGVRKVVVFAHHHEVHDGLIEALKEYQPVRITGKESPKQKDAAVNLFQEVEDVRLCICSTLAAGVGLTLTAASHVVFVEFDWVPANVVQAEDRCHRIGQSLPVMIEYLCFEDSLDQRMANLIVDKLNIADASLDTVRVDKQKSLKKTPSKDLSKPIYLIPETVSRPCPPEIKLLLIESIKQLASVCDGASQRDFQGFSGNWVRAGHWLATKNDFNDRECEIAARIVLHHRRQLGLVPADVQW